MQTTLQHRIVVVERVPDLLDAAGGRVQQLPLFFVERARMGGAIEAESALQLGTEAVEVTRAPGSQQTGGLGGGSGHQVRFHRLSYRPISREFSRSLLFRFDVNGRESE
jgi:hypothetical protein